MAYSALTVAKHFLSIPDEDAGELVSNLKLQKLLYYAQGHALGMNGKDDPLFADKVYAWKHGPVVKSVYNHYANFGAGALPHEARPRLDSDTTDFLNEIYRVYGRFSAWALREMTHREKPWLKNYKPDVMDIEIPLADMASFFKNRVEKARS
jgi:uncharacterized phage-associated protein